jgi:molybdopterin-guanine dinucleotide biosynthesis protein A
VTVGLILAGGRSRRFGAVDKAEANLCGISLAEWARQRAAPQVDLLMVSTNAPVPPRAFTGMAVIGDAVPGFRGPLAGILAGLEWLAARPGHGRWLVSFSVDSPFFPLDLVVTLAAEVRSDDGPVPVLAASGGRVHPVFGLWPVTLAPVLNGYLLDQEQSAVMPFARRVGALEVAFPDRPYDPFFNINRPDDLDRAADLCRRFGLAAVAQRS